jgi:hypothetical protein
MAAAAEEGQTAAEAKMAAIEEELAAMQAKLAAAEQAIAAAEQQPAAPAATAELDEFRRRYEMAMDDIHELRAKNAELQQQAVKARAAAPPAEAAASSGVLSWEAEKRRIMALLESSADDAPDVSPADRLKIEDLVRRTDEIIADKDREIHELTHLLQQQGGNQGTVAVGAAALGELLDRDAVIQEHREHLQRLQAEWEEKLRQAEIEVSLERAKLARERAKLEAQLQGAEREPAAAVSGGKPDKPARGRWLSRLGLKGDGE